MWLSKLVPNHVALACFLAASARADPSPVDPCAAAASSQAASLQNMNLEFAADTLYAAIDAETAYNCVKSVPFVAEDSSDLIARAKLFWSFQTTLAYLKNPPASYQQPAIDVMGRLDQITSNINAGKYQSQYDFDLDLYMVVSGTKEEHFTIFAGVLTLFTWLLSESFVAVSADGKAIPQVFAYSDIHDNVANPSPIVTVNGQDVYQYLQQYSNNNAVTGLIEPHAEFNVLMYNAAYSFGNQAENKNSYWWNLGQGTHVYNGPSLQIQFANGTSAEWAYYAGTPTSLNEMGITSGSDLYNKYVINPAIASGVPTASATAAAASAFVTSTVSTNPYVVPTSFSSAPVAPTLTSVPYPNYPANPDVIQDNLGNDGTVTGYLLEDISVGVLSLPSFSSNGPGGDSAVEFSAAVGKFITDASNAGMKKIIIDIQGNGGGEVLQGYDTFQRFFPTTAPTLGFRTRALDNLNTLGSFITGLSMGENEPPEVFVQAANSKFGALSMFDSAFSVTTNGEPWASWSDFYGPRQIYGDQFTNTFQRNLSSTLGAVSGFGQYVAGYGNNTLSYAQPWAAEDIMLLSDGSCGSTCSIFAELMKTDGGVRSVAVGGVPENGPMQSVSGTRGASVEQWALISTAVTAINEVLQIFGASGAAFLESFGLSMQDVQALPGPLAESRILVREAGYNAVDEIRAASPDDPLQFAYEAADCRLFFTAPMVRDITVLWRAVATVMNRDLSACVPGSTNAPGSKVNDTVTNDPGLSVTATWKNANTTQSSAAATSSKSAASADRVAASLAIPAFVALLFGL